MSLSLSELIDSPRRPVADTISIGRHKVARYIGEFWTSKQRQASSIHEISYRACFKPQLPQFFIELFTREGDIVYDPFSGRGTTVIEAGLLGRRIIANDVNPLGKILTQSRFFVPELSRLDQRLSEIPLKNRKSKLGMFFHRKTENEIRSLREYLYRISLNQKEDHIDLWIRMVATNRLTGHSKGFFSVYTLPPNQAVSKESQVRINRKLRQRPQYRDTRSIIIRKSRSLLRNLTETQKHSLQDSGKSGIFLNEDARATSSIRSNTVQLTVTSPPFLNVVDYRADNWLRCWFNTIKENEIASQITTASTTKDWSNFVGGVFSELYRITKHGGWVAFEVGEVRGGKVNLEEFVIPQGVNAGFRCEGLIMNVQQFTKTSNIWGISNNRKGTNTNRIALFHKA